MSSLSRTLVDAFSPSLRQRNWLDYDLSSPSWGVQMIETKSRGNVMECDTGIAVTLDVGSLTKEQLKVFIQGEFLVVEGKNETELINYRLGIAPALRTSNVEAKLDGSQLTVVVGEVELPKRREIPITTVTT